MTLGISLGEYSAQSRFESLWPQLKEVLQSHFNFNTPKIIGTFGKLPEGAVGSSWVSIDQMNANGLWAVLPKVPFFWRLLQKWKKVLTTQKVDLLILVDFADFNLRLAQIAKEAKVPVFWLAPPQMWAWRPERKGLLGGISLGCLFEFEAQLYQKWGLNAHWLGFKSSKKMVFDPKGPLAIFPGSRKAVIQRQAPLQIALAEEYFKHTGQEWVWVLPNEKLRGFAQSRFPEYSSKMTLQSDSQSVGQSKDQSEGPRQGSPEEQRFSRALALPGTATLEIALAGIPMQVVYRGGYVEKKVWLNNTKKKEIPHFALPNLLLQNRAYSESFFTNFASKFASNFASIKAEWPKGNEAETKFMPLIPERLIPSDEIKALESWITKKA